MVALEDDLANCRFFPHHEGNDLALGAVFHIHLYVIKIAHVIKGLDVSCYLDRIVLFPLGRRHILEYGVCAHPFVALNLDPGNEKRSQKSLFYPLRQQGDKLLLLFKRSLHKCHLGFLLHGVSTYNEKIKAHYRTQDRDSTVYAVAAPAASQELSGLCRSLYLLAAVVNYMSSGLKLCSEKPFDILSQISLFWWSYIAGIKKCYGDTACFAAGFCLRNGNTA